MRKQYRTKRRSCALCKPHKMGWAKRWKAKEWGKIREMMKEAWLTRLPDEQRS